VADVVAAFAIDDAGAVEATNRVTDGLNRVGAVGGGAARELEHEWNRSGAAFVARMISMRQIAAAVLGTFTVSGAILWFKGLVSESLKLAGVWDQIGASMTVANRNMAMFLNEFPAFKNFTDRIPELFQKMGAFFGTLFSAAGFKAFINDILNGTEEFDQMMAARLARIKAQTATEMARAWLGLPSAEDLASINENIHNALNLIGNDFLKGATNAAQFTAEVSTVISKLVKAGLVNDAWQVAGLAMGTLEHKLGTHGAAVHVLYEEYLRLRKSLVDAGATAEQIKGFDVLEKEIIRAHDWAAAMQEVFQQLGTSMGQTLAQGIFEGGLTLKNALAGILRDLARLAIVKALESTAVGILASTPWGQVSGLGDPAPYFIAAGVWGEIAGIATAAALAVGGRGSLAGRSGGSGGAGGGGFSAPAVAGSGMNQTINIVIEGPIDSEQRVRDITSQIAAALRSGSAGGSF